MVVGVVVVIVEVVVVVVVNVVVVVVDADRIVGNSMYIVRMYTVRQTLYDIHVYCSAYNIQCTNCLYSYIVQCRFHF